MELLAITDHDTLDAYSEAASDSLSLVTGVEFSCLWQKRALHIVGLNVDCASDAMAEAIHHQTVARNSRAEMIAEKLESYGVPTPLDGARQLAGDGTIGRPHFARHLLACGFVKDLQEAFKKYLGTGKPCDIKVYWPEPAQAIEWIRGAGGNAVLAHPGKYKFTRSWLVRCLEHFSACGGQGLEIVSGRQTPGETSQFMALSERFGLHQSLGSDFHSPEQHWLDLGRYSTHPPLTRPIWDLW